MNTIALCAIPVSSRVSQLRSLAAARRRRERILAALAFVSLILAWDATLRLDERVSPARIRMSHAVEMEAEEQSAGCCAPDR